MSQKNKETRKAAEIQAPSWTGDHFPLRKKESIQTNNTFFKIGPMGGISLSLEGRLLPGLLFYPSEGVLR